MPIFVLIASLATGGAFPADPCRAPASQETFAAPERLGTWLARRKKQKRRQAQKRPTASKITGTGAEGPEAPAAGQLPAGGQTGGADDAAAASGPTERPEDTILVLDLRPLGIDPTDAATITAQVADVLAAHTPQRVVTVDEINSLVELQRSQSMLGCAEESCMVELSKAANAHLALSGSVGRVGGEMVLSLSLLDVERSTPQGGGSRSVKSLAEIPEILPALVLEVLGQEAGAEGQRRFQLPEGEQVSLAVFDLKSLGVSPEVAGNLTQILAAELKQIEGASVISRDDIASMLELQAEKDKLDCADDVACLAEIGGALGVDKLVVGQVGKLDTSYVVSLRLIAVRTSVVESRATESFKGLEEQLLPAIRQAGRTLLGFDDAAPGVLALSASEQEADVYLDGEKIGVLPLPPVRELSPGRHAVRIAKDGFFDWQSDVFIEPRGTTPLWAAIEEEPPEWYERWWVWTIVGGVVAASAVPIIYFSVPRASGGEVTFDGGAP